MRKATIALLLAATVLLAGCPGDDGDGGSSYDRIGGTSDSASPQETAVVGSPSHDIEDGSPTDQATPLDGGWTAR